MSAVLKYDAACRAVAEARSLDEIRDWEDKAAAVREYSRRARNRSMELDALEIRERARRRRGEILIEMKAAGQLKEGRKKTVTDEGPFVTLEELDISKNESARDQRLAQVDGNSFERLIARCRAHLEEHPEKHSFSSISEGPVAGARSVMSSRVEPDDSLDYFPTPPWATRALIESVFPQIGRRGGTKQQRAWEPACGEGHISGVLEEYFATVVATDIHDYGADGRSPPGWWRTLNFLDPSAADGLIPSVDWIITNPPFGEHAEAFALRALSLANVGVAMFLRLQWLESIGRYERVFQPHPPALIAQFSERVPLHKGRWEPDGDTATAYLWIVWLKVFQGRTQFYWIPPGMRDECARADDLERFLAHPVIALARQEVVPTVFDPATGEIIESEAPQSSSQDLPPHELQRESLDVSPEDESELPPKQIRENAE